MVGKVDRIGQSAAEPLKRGRFNGHYVGASAPKHPTPGNGRRYGLISRETVSSVPVRRKVAFTTAMITDDFVQRFWDKVEKSEPDQCWLWTASVEGGGYGQIKIPKTRQQTKAHRVSWMIHYGDIPDGFMVLHRCDVRRCVNPDHLFLGTCADNLEDMAAKGRHLYGEKNARHRLTEAEVHRIFDLRYQGKVIREIASEFGVGAMTVHRILVGTRWKHIWQQRCKE